MANASAKKAAKAGQKAGTTYLPYIILSSALYALIRLFWWYGSTDTTHFVYFCIFSVLHIIAYVGLVQSAHDKTKGEMYFDTFVVNIAAQTTSTFTNWGRVFLLLIPAYMIYLGAMWFLKYRAGQAASTDNADTKPDEKTEKAPKTKYKRTKAK
mmetsp:Transcript_3068/g.4714  ORF Transcript_3068/g.4714 Transcript_3068/m.4714 type:complete len:154 (+) Transcript_3068:95-556(+)